MLQVSVRRTFYWATLAAAALALLVFPLVTHQWMCQMGESTGIVLLRVFCGHNLVMGLPLYYAAVLGLVLTLGFALAWWKIRNR